ncbi:MAG: response regulator, partial [Deltaproteobacteria bacterium]|nr:response regulator [Deltaproteobacteria bacterium]
VEAAAVAAGQDGELPLVSAHSLLGLPQPDDARACAVIGYGERRMGLVCDRIGTAEETVIKGLGPLLGQIPLCAGATITGKGHVAFILDPVALIRLAHPDAEPTAQARTRGDTTVTSARAPARVLVTDDSRTTRSALASILDRAGYVVDVAEDGERAWSLLGTTAYDALVTDIEMPGISGLDLAERVRADPSLVEIPIVVVTSRPRTEYKERARAIGVTELLTKPVPQTVLLSALRAGLKR